MFDQHLLNEKCRDQFVDGLDATPILLSIFTNLFHQRFEKHSMLESMLKILQQFYIQMETEPDEFCLLEIFPHTPYGVSDVASVLLFMVQSEKLYSMHLLQCYITETGLNPMTSKMTENQC